MELAIPLIALGGLFIVSNQKNKKCDSSPEKKETFVSMGKPKQNSYLPNTNLPPENFPDSLATSTLFENVQEYPNPNSATDKYFDQNMFENKVNQGIQSADNLQNIYSLSGNYMNSQEFKHANMVPFNGGKITGFTYNTDIAETLLDNRTGSGSQVIKKIEQAPLFKPENDVSWSYGMPNQSDFYQSRVNPVNKNNHAKPFESVNVGPGLGLGYTTEGGGGYNGGMMMRDSWLDKTVDELRVVTNPKLEYSLANHEGPANSYIKARGLIGRVEKNRPDTFFINTQDRWLTTTGAEKGDRLRPIEEMGVIRRADCLDNYMGPAGATDQKGNYTNPEFEKSRRNVWNACDVGQSSAMGKGPTNNNDQILESFAKASYPNNRSTLSQPNSYRSGFSGAIGAVIAPLMDILKPTRKEELVQNMRVYGERGTNVPSSYVNNPNDTPKTTNKETTLYSAHFNINNQTASQYVNNELPLNPTQRQTTDISYTGSAGGHGTQYGDMLYDAAYRQQNNDIKSQTIHGRTNQGNTQIFNPTMNVNISRQDANLTDNRWSTPSMIFPSTPSRDNVGVERHRQCLDQSINCERIAPSILNAFKNNPYTQSLTTSV